MSKFYYDFIIAGSGIVGLATAFKLSLKRNFKILILEKEVSYAMHQTGNNSGVIHSGIYYKPGSKKALNCKNGYNQLLQFSSEMNINYEICGKTGTAQNPHGDDHSIFIAFSPKESPEIAIAVYVENGGWGSTWAAPIGSLMIEKYLMNKIHNIDQEKFIINGSLTTK